MSKLVLFACLVLGTVYANTQVSLMNAKYDGSASISPGLVANLNDFLNVSTVQPSSFYGKADPPGGVLIIPATDYITLPTYSFVYGAPITFSVVNMDTAGTPPLTADVSTDNSVTLVENQSYTFVYIAQSDDATFSAYTTFPNTKLLPFEERPNPSPYGKALVRIVNIAVSTFDPVSNLTVTVIGNGVASRTVSLAFAEASDFLVYDAAVDLTLEFTLPVVEGFLNRTLSVSAVLDHTQVVYIRGDTGDFNRLGSLTRDIDFAFPAAPVSPPVTPPTAEPVSAPVADTPTAPVASTPAAPTTPTAHTPTKKVSSAAQTVAQIAGVAALASLLF